MLAELADTPVELLEPFELLDPPLLDDALEPVGEELLAEEPLDALDPLDPLLDDAGGGGPGGAGAALALDAEEALEPAPLGGGGGGPFFFFLAS